MKKDEIKKLTVKWIYLSCITFIVFELLWIPIALEYDEPEQGGTFKDLPFDFLACSLLSLVDCVALTMTRNLLPLKAWRSGTTFLIVALVFFSNAGLSLVLNSFMNWVCRVCFSKDPYILDYDFLDTYVISCLTSFVIVGRLLIWLSGQYNRILRIGAESKLQILKANVQPHFLFNAINTGQALIDSGEKEKASDYFSNMADCMRNVLVASDTGLVTVEEELRKTQPYFNMIRIRFGEIFDFKFQGLPDHKSDAIMSGTIQLVVENIIKHNSISPLTPMTVDFSFTATSLLVTNPHRPIGSGNDSFGIGHRLLDMKSQRLELPNVKTRIKTANGKGEAIMETEIPLFPFID